MQPFSLADLGGAAGVCPLQWDPVFVFADVSVEKRPRWRSASPQREILDLQLRRRGPGRGPCRDWNHSGMHRNHTEMLYRGDGNHVAGMTHPHCIESLRHIQLCCEWCNSIKQ